MKAAVYTEFGSPEVLQLKEVEKPAPKEDEVLIRVYATTVAAEDPGARSFPGLSSLRKPRSPILGWYLAGEIEAVGKNVRIVVSGIIIWKSISIEEGRPWSRTGPCKSWRKVTFDRRLYSWPCARNSR